MQFLKQVFKQIVAGTVLAVAAAGASAQYTSMYVFGDSLSDGGNNAAVIGFNPSQPITNTYIPTQPYGQLAYTNGRTWVNSFAAGLGLPTWGAPSFFGGGNYAYGGARTTADGAGGFPPSAQTVLNGFLASPPVGVSSSPLYVIAIGGNDVRDVGAAIAGGAPLSTINTAAAAYATAVGNMVDQLQARGAQNIIVWDVPNVGKAPAVLAQGAAASQLATGIATAFNTALNARMAGEAGVKVFDIFGLFNTVSANPGAYGLTNVVDACGGVVGCNPNQYLFWDGIHPTSAGQAIIANAMLAAAVPEPASVLMMAVGVAGVLVLRRRRQTASAPSA